MVFARTQKNLIDAVARGELLSSILPGVVKFLFLLLDLLVNLLPDLAKLKLGTHDLVLFLLKGTLSLLKGTLQLFLLNLKPAPLLVKLMDGTSAIAKLIQEVPDLISKVLVLPLNNVELLDDLLVSGAQAEQLAVVVAALLLAGLNLSCHVIGL